MPPVEPVTAAAPRPVRRPIMVQRWQDLTFLHWPVPPERVAPLLPPGVRPDVLDGVSYVGLIGFRMVGVGPLYGPGVPYLGTFCETNVRLYSVDPAGRRGVVFRSLEAERLVPVLTAIGGFRLPYKWARMHLWQVGNLRTYVSRRRWPGPRGIRTRLAARSGDRIAEPTEVEHFLTARWGLHVAAYGRSWYLPNEHPPWPLYRCELVELDDDLVAAAGLPGVTGEPPVSVLYSPGVPVVFGPPLPV